MLSDAIAAVVCIPIVAGTACATASPSARQATDIAPQRLDEALRTLARQRGFHIVYLPHVVGPFRTQGLKGNFTQDEALARLLDGTGLSFKYLDAETVTVVSPNPLAGMRSIEGAEVASAARRDSSVDTGRSNVDAGRSIPSVAGEIVVTGSRIVRDGYDAPTPVSVLGADELKVAATTQIGEAVNRMPMFSNSLMARASAGSISAGNAGASFLNLRGLGVTRTLVLLDGARLVGAAFNTNAVDINSIPAPLVSRVEVVTGGASAAYGSDAVAGVVNFILDRDFTGIKSELAGGVTTYGDDQQYKASFTAGTRFNESRGHVLFSAEHNYTAGLDGKPRPWASQAYQIMGNPAYTGSNGQPQFLVRDSVGLATAAPGGLINSGPLRGTAFGAEGIPYQLSYGALVSGNLMQGGDWKTTRIDDRADLDVRVSSTTAFSQASYDVTDNVAAFGQFQWATSESVSSGPRYFFLSGLNIAADNAFLPGSVRQAMLDNNLASVSLGTTNADLPSLNSDVTRQFRRFMLGAKGAWSGGWRWDAYIQRSTNELTNRTPDNIVRANYQRAIDAVVDPIGGDIVCRSALGNPDSGCVPYNVLGVGVASAAAKNYVLDDGWANNLLKQDAASVAVNGEPFATWAGPVSFAAGAEWRRDSIQGAASDLDEADAFFAGNYHATVGSYSVTEGFIETVLPLARDRQWIRSLEVNGAVRGTDYSTSGYVTTWKLGGSFQPADAVKLRVTRSRDIRAPSVIELFGAGRSGLIALTDPFNHNVSTVVQSRETGNPLLKPEIANAWGVGLVLAPGFLPGFGASIDYYRIDIDNAIATLMRQQYVDLCFQGITALCSAISRDASGRLSGIRIQPEHVRSQKTAGLDVEASYRFRLSDLVSSWQGDVTLRTAATRVFSLETRDPNSVIEGAGTQSADVVLNAPDLRYIASAAYRGESLGVTLTARGISSGKLDNAFFECAHDCPPSTASRPTIDRNRVASARVFDLAMSYRIADRRLAEGEVFLVVENFTNASPPVVPGTRTAGYHNGPDNYAYEVLGRIYRVGVRVRL